MAKHPAKADDHDDARNHGASSHLQPRTEPGNDRVTDTGRAPSGTGYPDGEPRQPVAEGTEPRTPAVSSPENPAAPRPHHHGDPRRHGERRLEDVKKGDLVRLLEPHYDGFQRFEAGSIVRWWNDTAPDPRNACLPDVPETPLSAPPMTDGKPPADYLDPSTGQKPVVGSA